MQKIIEGTPATLITASGKICLNEDKVSNDSILVCHHTDYDSYEAIMKCKGILTQVGGTLSHASIVARELKKACLIDCKGLDIYLNSREIICNGMKIKEGTMITIDGATGSVYLK
jgi:pyruvate,orthophosphate dikinase